MTEQEREILRLLRQRGYALCVFSPSELQGASSKDVEQELVIAGWDIIAQLRTEHHELPDDL